RAFSPSPLNGARVGVRGENESDPALAKPSTSPITCARRWEIRFEFVLRPAPPVTCISVARERRSLIGCTPATPAAFLFYAWKTRTLRAAPTKRPLLVGRASLASAQIGR